MTADECTVCFEGKVRGEAKPGRTIRKVGGGRINIPDDLLMPTCEKCGAEFIDSATAIALSALK